MGKPSRRRPLLPQVPFPFPRLTRFIPSHPHVRLRMGERGRQIRCSAPMGNISKLPLRLRMGERERQIRCSAPMGNISKLKRVRSRVTPRRTCQTLTSSSKVEATHRCSSSRPPLDLLNCPDEFKSLEMDRLLPCDLKNTSPTALRQYDDYLKWFYDSHGGPAAVKSLADAASLCLEKENSMVSLWLNSGGLSNLDNCTVSRRITEYMRTMIEENGEIERPFGIDAAECIAKENELISEWLRHGRLYFTKDDEYILCYDIRTAVSIISFSRLEWSFHIAAALVGIRKEAEWLIENLKRNSGESISTSMKIRRFALDFLWEKYNELYEPYKVKMSTELERLIEIPSNSDDTESDGDDTDSDGDAAESQYKNYMGDCHDEDYMTLYC